MTDRIDVLIDLTRRLSAMVEDEIGMIERRAPHRLAEHEDERSRLALHYAREMQAMRAEPSNIRALTRERIERLKDETAAFNGALDRHRRLIARMRRVTEGIIKAVADEAANQRAPQTAYARPGAALAPYTRPAAPLAFNRKI